MSFAHFSARLGTFFQLLAKGFYTEGLSFTCYAPIPTPFVTCPLTSWYGFFFFFKYIPEKGWVNSQEWRGLWCGFSLQKVKNFVQSYYQLLSLSFGFCFLAGSLCLVSALPWMGFSTLTCFRKEVLSSGFLLVLFFSFSLV